MAGDGAGDPLYQWVIYWNPSDCPGKYVVREWIILPGRFFPGRLISVAATLEEARARVPPGLYNLGRQPGDDPAIAEVWI